MVMIMLDGLIKIFFNLDNGNKIIINKNELEKIYISNINKNGDEIPYSQAIIKNKLLANFFLFRFIDTKTNNIYNELKENNILTVNLIFEDKNVEFIPSSTVDPFKNSHNEYQKEYLYKDSSCLIISEYKIKYLKNLLI